MYRLKRCQDRLFGDRKPLVEERESPHGLGLMPPVRKIEKTSSVSPFPRALNGRFRDFLGDFASKNGSSMHLRLGCLGRDELDRVVDAWRKKKYLGGYEFKSAPLFMRRKGIHHPFFLQLFCNKTLDLFAFSGEKVE